MFKASEYFQPEEVENEYDNTHLEKSIWLIPYIRKRINENRNFIALFVGDTGSGKSYSAISLAEQIDPNFSVDQIVFTVQDFVHLLNHADMPKASCIIFDDAGLGINARLWQQLSVRIFGMITQAYRFKQYITLITTPKMNFIEKQSRQLIHLIFEATGKQGIMKPYRPFPSPYNPEQTWRKYPTKTVDNRTITITSVRFKLPSEKLRNAYEQKKMDYMNAQFKKFEEDMQQLEEAENTKKEKANKEGQSSDTNNKGIPLFFI